MSGWNLKIFLFFCFLNSNGNFRQSLRVLWLKTIKINLSASTITGDFKGVLRGSSAKLFVISLNMPSIVTDIKAPKWEGETVKLIKIIKDPLIVLESYIYVCVPIWWNFFNFLYLLNSTGVFNINLMGCFIKIFKYPFNSYWKLR